MIRLLIWTIAALFGICASGFAADTNRAQVIRDIPYAKVDGMTQGLDLHLPKGVPKSPTLVWIHGGAWRSGSKASMPLGALVEEGYAVASVDYRLSTQARFPAQIHDLKAAVRFLRAHGADWQLSTSAIVVAGDSAGGHLAALVGVSNTQKELEGTVGDDLKRDSSVQGIVSFYGAANLTTILKQSTPHGLSVRVPALDLLLGGQPDAVPELARLASPVFHVDRADPPLLLFHGDQDPQMPVNQAHELVGAYRKLNLPVRFEIVYGAAHGGDAFYDAERMAIVKAFLENRFGK